MKLKKYLLICSIIIISISLSLFLFLNISININKDKNKKVLDTFNNIFDNKNLDISLEYDNNYPKLQIDGTDYIGVISIEDNNLLLPIKSNCNSSFLNIESSCYYSDKPFIILGTNLNDSFNSLTSYNENNIVIITNTLGKSFQYKIKKITRMSNIEDLSQYNEPLIIAIKNYYGMEYLLLICDYY